MNLRDKYIMEQFHIDEKVINYCNKIEEEIKPQFEEIDRITEYNQLKVLAAMQKNKLSDSHFAATTGYGYNDLAEILLKRYTAMYSIRKMLLFVHSLYRELMPLQLPLREIFVREMKFFHL